MILRPLTLLTLFAVSGCAGQVAVPAQPTTTSVNASIADLAAISTSPVAAWHAGDYAVRAACHVYLNGAAAQAARTNQLGLGAGALGAGLSVAHPLAGVASSLFQSFLSAYQAAGALPYTSETSTIVFKALDNYEAQVDAAPPASTADAMSYIDDEWFMCSPGGYAQLVSAAISTADVGGAPSPTFSSLERPLLPRRPTTTVNGKPI